MRRGCDEDATRMPWRGCNVYQDQDKDQLADFLQQFALVVCAFLFVCLSQLGRFETSCEMHSRPCGKCESTKKTEDLNFPALLCPHLRKLTRSISRREREYLSVNFVA